MDLTHKTASVVVGQQYSRSGHLDIYHGRKRLGEGVFSEEVVSKTIGTVA